MLVGAAGTLGAAVAAILGTATPAQAADGDPVLQGKDNGPTTARTLVTTANFAEFASLADHNTANNQGSVGVWGHGNDSGVVGESIGGGIGVTALGGSNDGYGVWAVGGGFGFGVNAIGGASGGPGVVGNAGGGNGDGVVGYGSGTGAGLYGTGGSSGGAGVHGIAGSASGAGVLAQGTSGGDGDALAVNGRATFSTSGVVTVAAGHSTATETGVKLTASSLVLVTLQRHEAGVYVQAAVPNVAGGSFTVYLSKAVNAKTKVAWFVIN